MTDYLVSLPEEQVAVWYRRLADSMTRELVNGKEPLASLFLRHWLDNRDPTSTFTFAPPRHLQTNSYVTMVLQYHRAVFLTEQKARIRGSLHWAGVLPRIQSLPGFTRWNMTAPIDLEYESLVEVGNGMIDLVRIQRSGTREERDLLTSLRGFQLRSRVTVRARPSPAGRITINLSNWRVRIRDRYDWDYNEHFTVPNPDFRSASPNAVRPNDETLTVYHRNAQRLELARLAAPYDVESEEWIILDSTLIRPGEVDPSRHL